MSEPQRIAELQRLKKPGTTGLRYQGIAWTQVTVAALWDSVVKPVGEPLRVRLSGVFSSSLASTTGAFASSSMSPGHSSSACIGFGTTCRVGSSIETFL